MWLHELSISAMTLAQVILAVCYTRLPKQNKTKACSHCEWTRRGPLAVTQPLHTQTKQKQNKKRTASNSYGPDHGRSTATWH